jgi:hypothetical protein
MMASTPLRVDYRLDGASNFLSWKERVTLELKDYELLYLVEEVIVPSTNLIALEAHKKKEIKAKRVILDLVKDH